MCAADVESCGGLGNTGKPAYAACGLKPTRFLDCICCSTCVFTRVRSFSRPGRSTSQPLSVVWHFLAYCTVFPAAAPLHLDIFSFSDYLVGTCFTLSFSSKDLKCFSSAAVVLLLPVLCVFPLASFLANFDTSCDTRRSCSPLVEPYVSETVWMCLPCECVIAVQFVVRAQHTTLLFKDAGSPANTVGERRSSRSSPKGIA